MDKSFIENFITFCDNVTIANEGLLTKNERYNEFQKVSNEFNKKINHDKNLKKRVEMYKKYKDHIENIYKNITNDSESESSLNMLIKGPKAIFKDKLLQNSRNSSLIMSNIKKEIESIANKINLYEYAIKKGANTINDISSNDGIVSSIEEIDNVMKLRQTLNQIKPVNIKLNSKEEYVEFMISDTINFLKKYIASSEFKKRYKEYLYMINIQETDYGDLFSITITDFQNGMNKNDDDNTWYHELLDIGKEYISKRFEQFRGKVWHDIDTGDGDEGTIYVN